MLLLVLVLELMGLLPNFRMAPDPTIELQSDLRMSRNHKLTLRRTEARSCASIFGSESRIWAPKGEPFRHTGPLIALRAFSMEATASWWWGEEAESEAMDEAERTASRASTEMLRRRRSFLTRWEEEVWDCCEDLAIRRLFMCAWRWVERVARSLAREET